MTSKIEETKREMYRALAALKSGGRWLMKKANAEAFEEAFESHLLALLEERRELESVRKNFESLAVHYTQKSISLEDENRSLKARLDEALGRVDIYGDAHHHQVNLTRSACIREREMFDDLFETKRKLASAETYKQDCIDAEAAADRLSERVHQQKVLIAAQRQAIGQMYMLKKTMSKQIVALVDENELLRTAARVAGEELRSSKIASYFAINSDLIKFAKPHQCEVFVNGGCTGCGRRLVEEA